jgi:plasmid stabilization system protein ParE
MAYRVIIQPRAEADIATAFSYLADRAPEIANAWYRRVLAEMESLAEMPSRCPMAPESDKVAFELRHLLYGKRPGVYRIVFRIVETAQEVHILTVRHSARKPLSDEDIQSFLQL